MNPRAALFELLEARRLMSATGTDVPAAEPSDTGGAEVAGRRNLVTLHSYDVPAADGSSTTILIAEALPTHQIWDSNTRQTRQFSVVAEM